MANSSICYSMMAEIYYQEEEKNTGLLRQQNPLACIRGGSTEQIRPNQPYFVVGLSDGLIEGDTPYSLPMDILRYLSYLKQNEGLVLVFDAARIDDQEEHSARWATASDEMKLRVQSICRVLFQGELLPVAMASDVVNNDRQRFDQIVLLVEQVIFADDGLMEKMWKILPPAIKKENQLPQDCNYSNLSDESKIMAKKLMRYEVLHIAFILFSSGTKICHGRSEQRSIQILEAIKKSPAYQESFMGPDNNGLASSPPGLRETRMSPLKYPNPYNLDGPDATEALLQRGQITLRFDLYAAVAASHLTPSAIGKYMEYLAKNTPAGGIAQEPAPGDSKTVLGVCATVANKIIWPIEKQELIDLKSIDRRRYLIRLKAKIADIERGLSLLPALSLLKDELMPFFFESPPSSKNPEEYLKWLGGGLGDPCLKAILNFDESEALGVFLKMIKDLMQIAGEGASGTAASWVPKMIEIDMRFNGARFASSLRESKNALVLSDEERRKAATSVIDIAKGLDVTGPERISYEWLYYGLAGISFNDGGPSILPALSQETIDFVISNIVLPYLKGNLDDIDYQKMISNRRMDLVVQCYVALREKELDLSLAARCEIAQQALRAIGLGYMLQIPSKH